MGWLDGRGGRLGGAGGGGGREGVRAGVGVERRVGVVVWCGLIGGGRGW